MLQEEVHETCKKWSVDRRRQDGISLTLRALQVTQPSLDVSTRRRLASPEPEVAEADGEALAAGSTPTAEWSWRWNWASSWIDGPWWWW